MAREFRILYISKVCLTKDLANDSSLLWIWMCTKTWIYQNICLKILFNDGDRLPSVTTVQRCYEILSSQTEAALRQCEPRRPAPVPDPIVKILISHPLSVVNTSILRARSDFQTVQKSYRLTSSSNDNVVKNHPLSHLSCFWRAARIPDLCLFSQNLYCQFYRRILMSILHIVKTGKKEPRK